MLIVGWNSGDAMNQTFNLDQFNYTQVKLLYCAIDSPRYTTELLIERDLPGRASPPPDLDQVDLSGLEQGGWVIILGKQIDIEPSVASKVQHQRLLEAIDDPARAELIDAAQRKLPKVVMARIQYQLTDKAILALVPIKRELKVQFDRSEEQSNILGKPIEEDPVNIRRIYVITGGSVGQFSVRSKIDLETDDF